MKQPCYHKKWLLLFVYVLLLSLHAASQYRLDTLRIKIEDKRSNSISDAILNAKYGSSKTFALSNVQGMVQIYLPDIVTSNQDTVYLSITHIAYARFDTAFAVSPNNGLSYKIVLQDTARHLDEVLVIAKPIEKHGDTTSFNVSSFKVQIDENLEDIIRRLPGFSIDGSGNISYNGIPIEKILIEGDELSNNYKSISKNLTPEILSKIQLIEKYQNNPLLKDLIASNKQVINLVLKENAKLKPSGSLKLGLGIYDVYNADINVIGLKAKSKTLLLGSLNNIGKSQYDENGGNLQSFESNDTEIEAFRFQDAMTRQTTNQPSAFAIPNTSTLFNQSGFVSLNQIFGKKENTQLRFLNDVYWDNIRKEDLTSFTNKILPGQSFLQDMEKNFKPLFINSKWDAIRQREKSRTVIQAKFKYFEQVENNLILSDYKTTQWQKNKNISLSAGIFYTYRPDSTKAINAILNFENISQDENGIIQKENSITILPGYENRNFNQEVIINGWLTRGKWQFLKKYSGSNYEFVVDGYIRKLNAQSALRYDSGNNQFKPIPGAINNGKQVLGFLQPGIGTNGKHKQVQWQATMSTAITAQSLDNLFASQSSKIMLLPNGNLRFKLAKGKSLGINAGFETQDPMYLMLLQHPFLNSFRSISRDSTSVLPISVFKSGINFSFSNNKKGLFGVLNYGYIRIAESRITEILSTSAMDRYLFRYQQIPTNFHNLLTRLDKYSSRTKTAFSIRNQTMLFNNYQQFEGTVATNKMLQNEFYFSIRPTMPDYLKITPSFEHILQTDVLSGNTNYQYSINADFSSIISKRFSFTAQTKLVKSNLFVYKNMLPFVNVFAWYTIKQGKMDLKLKGLNLANSEFIYRGTTNAAYDYTTAQRLLPKFMMVEFSYRF
jgi:hypothetical protein